MVAWAIGVGVLLRDGHYLLAIVLGITWPIGLNVVMGVTICFGDWLTRRIAPQQDGGNQISN